VGSRARVTVAPVTVGRASLFGVFIVALFASGGCSWLFVDSVPDGHRQGDAVECTTSRALPVVDTVLAASHLVGLAYLQTASYTPDQRQQVNVLGYAEFIGLLVYTSSAVHGYMATSDCIAAVESSNQSAPLLLNGPARRRPASPPRRNLPPAEPTAGPAPSPEPALQPQPSSALPGE
jgi:hypothetical protein